MSKDDSPYSKAINQILNELEVIKMSNSIQTKRLKKDESQIAQNVMYGGEWKDYSAHQEAKAKWDFTKELRELSERMDELLDKVDHLNRKIEAHATITGNI